MFEWKVVVGRNRLEIEKLSSGRDSSDQITDSRKQEVPGDCPALCVESRRGLVAVVIVVVPVAVGAPTVAVFIPPAVRVFPAPGAGFRQLVAPLGGLRAVPTVPFGGFVELVVDAGDAPLAVVVRAQRSGANEEKCRAQS